MQFYEPSNLLYLWLIPAVLFAFWWGSRQRQKRLLRIGNPAFIQDRLMPGFSVRRQRVGEAFLIAILLLATLALARPQWGEEKQKIERKGVDLIFLLDTSLSMLAEDIKPNRFGKAKLAIKEVIRQLKGDRVGMIAFARSSFLQCPLTLDYAAFLLFLDSLKVGYIPNPGTSLARALELAVKAFPEESRKYRAVIIFSDGEDHEGGIEEAIQAAKKSDIRVYVIGTGTPEGEPIPLRSVDSTKVTAYKKDRNGQVVITRLNSELLGEIARQTGGLYLPATSGEKEIEIILKHLESLGERQLKERLVTEREDHFQIFLFLAFFLLVGESLLGNKKQKAMNLTLLPLISLFLFSGFIDSPTSLVKKGNRQVEEKKYKSAVENYRKAGVVKPNEPVIRYNLGTALYRLYEYRDAEKELEQALAQAKDKSTRAKILYNYGNTQYRLGNFEKAIDAYKKVLDIDPKDEDAKYNLEFLRQKKALFEEKDQERKKEKEKNQQQPQPQPRQQQQKQQQQQQQDRGGQGEGTEGRQEEERKEEVGEGEQQEGQHTKQQNEMEEEEKQRQSEQQKELAKKASEAKQEKEEQEKKEEQKAGAEMKPEEDQKEDQKVPRPLQGQMSIENALQILDALQEGERKLQDLRRPPVEIDSDEAVKDW